MATLAAQKNEENARRSDAEAARLSPQAAMARRNRLLGLALAFVAFLVLGTVVTVVVMLHYVENHHVASTL